MRTVPERPLGDHPNPGSEARTERIEEGNQSKQGRKTHGIAYAAFSYAAPIAFKLPSASTRKFAAAMNHA